MAIIKYLAQALMVRYFSTKMNLLCNYLRMIARVSIEWYRSWTLFLGKYTG